MIVRNLIKRPIAVTMCLIAIVVVGIFSFKYIPVSLMPNIDIPHITVQVAYPGASVREVDAKAVAPLRNQLMQVAGLKSIRSESKSDAGTIFMTFETGSNIDLLFIEVNEKMDRAMNQMPKELERPKAIKASAMDIPAFYLDITLKNEHIAPGQQLPSAGVRFTQLGVFARNIVAKRIEQLPQTAMVDISGTGGTEIICTPYQEKLEAMGLTLTALENAIKQNNITLGALTVADGLYRYSIHFDSQLISLHDIRQIYLNHEGRLFRFSDLCEVIEQPATRAGWIRHDKNNAVTLAVIKQNDAQMEELQASIDNLLDDLRREYTDISFDLTRDQTKLLSYSINNLKNNLYLGALLACLVLFLFMRNWRLPMLIIITIPLTLVLTLLSFHLLGITLNIISLSGLILGVGMIVDNSIIVIDNIVQRWQSGLTLKEAVVQGTNQVFTPMLTSVLTTCSVFVPLIFLSGTPGALFYDQAMGVTIALFASLLVVVLVLPVYFFALYRKRERAAEDALTPHEGIRAVAEDAPHDGNSAPARILSCGIDKTVTRKRGFNYYRPYERTLKWVLRHPRSMAAMFLFILASTYFLYDHIDKTHLPYMKHHDALMTLDWNAGISVEENDKRIAELIALGEAELQSSTSTVGVHDFILSHTKDLTTSEAIVYLNAHSEADLLALQEKIVAYIAQHYPRGSVEFSVSGNIFDLIFASDEADLEIRLQNRDGGRPTVVATREFIDTLVAHFPTIAIQPVVVDKNIRYVADIEQMTNYGITYEMLSARLKALINKNSVYQINDGGKSIPVIIGASNRDSETLLQNSIKNAQGVDIPLRYLIMEGKGEDFKRLYSGSGGDYYPLKIAATDREVKEIVAYTQQYAKKSDQYSATFGGDYYSSRELIRELMWVMSVAIALLYFILAAQFESIVQPLIILTEIIIDLFFVFLGLWLFGESLNIMSMIGIVVMSGIIINDSILKVDTINRLHRGGMSVLRSIMVGGHSRLKPILMTSLTTILAVAPFLHRTDMGSALQYPLSLTLIIGMVAGTLVSLFFIPLMYYLIYRKK